MKTHPFLTTRFLTALLALAFVLGGGGPIDLTPSAEAATSAQKRKLRKFKKAARKFKKQVRILRSQLATALLPVPVPVTPAPPTPGMVPIPAGSFQMGDETGNGGNAEEVPRHFVFVSAFHIDQFEVTKALWDTVTAWGAGNGYNDLTVGGSRGNFHPVQSVSWYDVVKWCNARSEMEGLTPVYYTSAAQNAVYRTGVIDLEAAFVKWAANGFRLPTESEWEKAARGDLVPASAFPWGNSINGGDANYRPSGDPFEDKFPSTAPVGYYDGGQVPEGPDRANGYGLYDVAGNVSEWCWDWYDPDYYGPPAPPSSDPRGPASSPEGTRVIRGGDWSDDFTTLLRCARRFRTNPAATSSTGLGFRTVRSD